VHGQARQDLRVAVEELEPRVHEVEPVRELRRFASGPVELGALRVEGGVFSDRVLRAVVKVQVRVDDQADVARRQFVVIERAGDRSVYHPPAIEPLLRPADTSIYQRGTAGKVTRHPCTGHLKPSTPAA
jgi:hypothetical protein